LSPELTRWRYSISSASPRLAVCGAEWEPSLNSSTLAGRARIRPLAVTFCGSSNGPRASFLKRSPGDIEVFFFTNGGAESNENAFKIARSYTGRQKILARYRSYHDATAAAMSATGVFGAILRRIWALPVPAG